MVKKDRRENPLQRDEDKIRQQKALLHDNYLTELKQDFGLLLKTTADIKNEVIVLGEDVKHIRNQLEGHHKTLFADDGRGGICADIEKLKSQIKEVKSIKPELHELEKLKMQMKVIWTLLIVVMSAITTDVVKTFKGLT